MKIKTILISMFLIACAGTDNVSIETHTNPPTHQVQPAPTATYRNDSTPALPDGGSVNVVPPCPPDVPPSMVNYKCAVYTVTTNFYMDETCQTPIYLSTDYLDTIKFIVGSNGNQECEFHANTQTIQGYLFQADQCVPIGEVVSHGYGTPIY